MKNFLFTFVFLFIVTFAYAQKQVNYVSFFPPAHVTHSEVTLTQNNDSFSYANDFISSNGSLDYTALKGGIILGATQDSTTTIKNMTVNIPSGHRAYAISNFKVDNIIRVSAKGLIRDINIGIPCNQTSSSCNEVFISANSVSLPYSSLYPTNIEVDISVSDTADISAKIIDGVNNFLPAFINSNNKLKWVNLRIRGTEECRPYLVSYTGSDPQSNCE